MNIDFFFACAFAEISEIKEIQEHKCERGRIFHVKSTRESQEEG